MSSASEISEPGKPRSGGLPKDILWNLPYEVQKGDDAGKLAYLQNHLRRIRFFAWTAFTLGVLLLLAGVYGIVIGEVTILTVGGLLMWVLMPWILKDRIQQYEALATMVRERLKHGT